MTILADEVEVTKSELASFRKVVPRWETDLLRAVHGEDAVQVVSQVELDQDPPDATEEYIRLEGRYISRDEEGSRKLAIHDVYGKHGPGVIALGRAIKAATVKKQAAA